MADGVNSAKQAVGTCSFMCPESERLRRERLQQLSVFEIESSPGRVKHGRAVSSFSLAVKEYVRAGAGHVTPRPDELRPPGVLLETTEYLMTNIVDRKDYPWHVVYGFVNNRCQSVRQDITYQQLKGKEVLRIYELSCRFYIYAQYRLAEVSVERFDPKLNRDQIQHCLSRVLRLYNEHSDTVRGVAGGKWAEFEAYFLLTNLGSTEAMNHALQSPSLIRKDRRVVVAMEMNSLSLENNFVHLFRLLVGLSTLGRCAVHPHVLPLQSFLVRWFRHPGTQGAVMQCRASGLEVAGGNVSLKKVILQFSEQAAQQYHQIPEVTGTEKHMPSFLILNKTNFQ